MRTTVTFDPDVAAQLQRLRSQRHGGLHELVNSAMRIGLAHLDAPAQEPASPATTPVSLGRLLLPALDDVSEALAPAAGDGHG